MACNCGNNNCTGNCNGNCTGKYGDSPECCGEVNPNCCEICNCLRFTSTNDTIDISKVGCDFDIKVSPNLLQNLLDIPSSGCISMVKELINGKLVFTPTLNIQCLEDLIPDIPVIPDVPVYTADNGIDMNTFNIQLGGLGNPLLHDTVLLLGGPTSPYKLSTYQNDSSDSTPVIENIIGKDGTKNIDKTTLKSGIASSDTESIVEQNSDKFEASVQTVKNIQTDIAYLAPGYISVGEIESKFGFNYPITVNAISHAIPSQDVETSSMCKASSGDFSINAKTINLTSGSTSASILNSVPNGYFNLYSTTGVAKIQSIAYDVNKLANPMFISEAAPNSYFAEIELFNDRDGGPYYAHSAVKLSDYSALLGAKIGNVKNNSFAAPANDNEETSYFLATKSNAEVSAKKIDINSKSTVLGSINFNITDAYIGFEYSNGFPKYTMVLYDTATHNTLSLAYITPGLIDLETIYASERNAGSFYAQTMITGNGVGNSAFVNIGVYVPNSTDLGLYSPPAIDLNNSSYTKYRRGTIGMNAKATYMNGKVAVVDMSANPPIDPDGIAECAALEVRSVKGGLLLPRVTTVQRMAIANPIGGLEVFDYEMNAKMTYDNTKWTGFRYNGSKFQGYTGSSWVDLN